MPNLVDECLVWKNGSLGNGWRSDWFGAFSVHLNGWIYHADLGWAYAVGDDQEGFGYGQEKEVGYGQLNGRGLIYGNIMPVGYIF